MPTPFLQKLSRETGKSLETLESYWSEAKETAQQKGLSGEDLYAYTTSVVKKRAGLAEHLLFIQSSKSAKDYLK